jgi:hypothetical protein
VVSTADPYERNLDFCRPEQLLFLPSSPSIVLTTLSGPRLVTLGMELGPLDLENRGDLLSST